MFSQVGPAGGSVGRPAQRCAPPFRLAPFSGLPSAGSTSYLRSHLGDHRLVPRRLRGGTARPISAPERPARPETADRHDTVVRKTGADAGRVTAAVQRLRDTVRSKCSRHAQPATSAVLEDRGHLCHVFDTGRVPTPGGWSGSRSLSYAQTSSWRTTEFIHLWSRLDLVTRSQLTQRSVELSTRYTQVLKLLQLTVLPHCTGRPALGRVVLAAAARRAGQDARVTSIEGPVAGVSRKAYIVLTSTQFECFHGRRP